MILTPANLDALIRGLKDAFAKGEKIHSIRLGALRQIVEHTPEDMTATVEAGLPFAEFQTTLAKRGQWLPLDPPGADRLTLGELLSTNASGPRRFGWGTVRDYLIGIKVVLADGRLIKAGGKVVKNVAGYDLCKLFVGARGTLGVIVEATFKLTPIPQAEQFVQAEFEALDQAGQFLDSVLASDLTPIVLDLHSLSTVNSQRPKSLSEKSVSGSTGYQPVPSGNLPDGTGETSINNPGAGFVATSADLPAGRLPTGTGRLPVPPILQTGANRFTVILGFAGAKEDVDYQLKQARELGASSPSGLDYEREFWAAESGGAVRRLSVLPSELIPALRQLGADSFVARAGNGIVAYRGGPEPKQASPTKLMLRIKDAYDSKHILPEWPA